MLLNARIFCATVALSLLALSLPAADPASPTQTAQPAAGKSYQIRNKEFGDLLRPRDANSADGTPIVLYSAQPWKCMTWKCTAAGESQFFLQNHFTSKTFAAKTDDSGAVAQVPYGKTTEGRPAWQFTKLADGTYKITEAKTGKALSALKDASGSGVKIVLQPWSDSAGQKWELTETDPKSLTM
jgi:hypothetical protein